MRKLSLKKFFGFFFPFLFCYGLIFSFNKLADYYSYYLASFVSQVAGPSVEVKRVRLSLSQTIEMQDVRFTSPSGFIMSMGQVNIDYSFGDLFHQRFVIKDIQIQNSQIDLLSKKSRKPSVFLHLKAPMPEPKEEGFTVVFDNSKICFDNLYLNFFDSTKNGIKKTLALDFCITTRKNRMIWKGSIDKRHSTIFAPYAKNEYLSGLLAKNSFSLDLENLNDSLVINKIETTFGPYSIFSSGVVHELTEDPLVDMRLYTSPVRLDKMPFFANFNPIGGDVGITGRITGRLSNLRINLETLMPMLELKIKEDIMTLDELSLSMNYSAKKDELVIEKATGLVDGHMKFSAEGTVSNIKNPLFNIRCLIAESAENTQGSGKTQYYNAGMKGTFEKGRFKGHGYFVANNAKKTKQYIVGFNEATLTSKKSEETQNVFVRIPGVYIRERNKEEGKFKDFQRLEFQSLEADLTLNGKQTTINDFTLKGYGGSVKAKGYFHFYRDKTKYSLTVDLDGLHFTHFRILDPFDCQFSGNINGMFLADNRRTPLLKGLIVASDFTFNGLEPLDQVADYIGISSLKNISQAEVALDFYITPQRQNIKRFDIDAPGGISLRSNYVINEENWLEGNVALSLPRSVLLESKIFKTLLSMARERGEQLDFVVRLSGFADSLRTELIKSDFRDKLKERASVGIQKIIERELNKSLGSGL